MIPEIRDITNEPHGDVCRVEYRRLIDIIGKKQRDFSAKKMNRVAVGRHSFDVIYADWERIGRFETCCPARAKALTIDKYWGRGRKGNDIETDGSYVACDVSGEIVAWSSRGQTDVEKIVLNHPACTHPCTGRLLFKLSRSADPTSVTWILNLDGIADVAVKVMKTEWATDAYGKQYRYKVPTGDLELA